MAKALDDLSDIAFQNAKRHEFGMNLGFGGPLGLEDMSGRPDAFENGRQTVNICDKRFCNYRSYLVIVNRIQIF